MNLNIDTLKRKKIGILGFGIEGKDTFEYLLKHGIKAIIFDRAESVEFNRKNPKLGTEITRYLGDNYLNNISEVDVIFKTPGIPILKPELQAAIRKGVIVTSQLEYFFDQTPAKIIGITGTKGKGTTATLIYQILKKSKKDIYLGGNIGLSAITFLDKLTPQSLVVLELSSYQLQSLKKSPEIAVLLNVTQDHLDYHKSVSEYHEAKRNIINFQNKNDFSIINADYKIMSSFIGSSKGRVYQYSKKKITNGCYVDKADNIVLQTIVGPIMVANANQLLLRGRHNLENVTASILAAFLAGADINSIQSVVKNFHGLEHRLELVGKVDGVAYYNDSFSTIPETAIAAIRSFDEPIILILGGSCKGSDYTELGREIVKSKVKSLILIGEMANDISEKISSKFIGNRIFGLSTMKDIIEKTRELSTPGDVVLLSPACASFGLFNNYKDRGNQFKEEFRKL